MALKTRHAFEPWMYCLPSILVIALVAVAPLAQTIYLAFTDARLGFVETAHWVGVRNFWVLVQDPAWWLSVSNTLLFCGVSVALELTLGLLLALVLNSRIKGRAALRAAVLIPWAIPTVVSAKMWAWMFNDIYGVINEILLRIGWIESPLAWLADRKLSLVAMILVDVWKSTPFAALLLLAGLQGIPKSILEAARVDGASRWNQFVSITLPLLRPAIVVTAIFRLLDALRVFDLPFVLTSNSKNTMVMSGFARQQLVDFQDVGYGSAASLLIFCVIGVIAVVYLALSGTELAEAK